MTHQELITRHVVLTRFPDIANYQLVLYVLFNLIVNDILEREKKILNSKNYCLRKFLVEIYHFLKITKMLTLMSGNISLALIFEKV